MDSQRRIHIEWNPEDRHDRRHRTYPLRNLNVTSEGVVVFAMSWPLVGATNITLNPAAGSIRGPLINGSEIFQLLDLGGRTHTRDVIALEKLRNSIQNPPPDWEVDPCLDHQCSWTGVTSSDGLRFVLFL